MVSKTPVMISVEISAAEAANIAVASNPLASVFAKIREAARLGHFQVVLGGTEVSVIQAEKLRSLGYTVEGGRAIIISWGP
jgi:hypothetical protein